jgi:hypothetical protein
MNLKVYAPLLGSIFFAACASLLCYSAAAAQEYRSVAPAYTGAGSGAAVAAPAAAVVAPAALPAAPAAPAVQTFQAAAPAAAGAGSGGGDGIEPVPHHAEACGGEGTACSRNDECCSHICGGPEVKDVCQ